MKITPIILQADSQEKQVRQLCEYCLKLDGTEIVVLDREFARKSARYLDHDVTFGTALPYPYCNNAAFAYAAQTFKGKAFMWMEADSIPLRPGWLQDLTDEFVRSGKDFMLTSDSRPPYDYISGIGIYGPETHWLIPKQFVQGGWDGWMLKNLAPIIHRTPLIQHSYGAYEQPGHPPENARPYRFPADIGIIRPDAKIFHRDVYQDLTILGTAWLPQHRFLHSGDLGDIIAAMPVIRQLGGGIVVITEMPPVPGKMPRETMKGERFEAIKPLLLSQRYIRGVEWHDTPTGITHDFTQFRMQGWDGKENLADWQARGLGISNLDLSPWINIAGRPNERIVINRSLRYHGPRFPWGKIYDRFGNRLLFVGLPEEHLALQSIVGHPIEYRPTKDLLVAAELIYGADLFVGNQSAPFWIAVGLGTDLIQEVWPQESNAIVPRPNATYVVNGELFPQ